MVGQRFPLRTRIHFFIGLTGLLVFCSGILMVVSAVQIGKIGDLDTFYGKGKTNCQFWAGTPTILTGVVLLLTVHGHKKRPNLKYVSMGCVLITMFVTFGVIIEEATNSSDVHAFLKDHSNYCDAVPVETDFTTKELADECKKIKQASRWYYFLLFTADAVLVLCTFVLLVLFGDWILFVASKAPHNEQVELTEQPPPYESGCSGDRLRSGQCQQTWNVQCDQTALPLHRV